MQTENVSKREGKRVSRRVRARERVVVSVVEKFVKY